MPRETLTRGQIVRAAVELLDSDGIEGLSMRQLGGRLGSAATSVYWHVQSKENLVVLACDAVWEEIDLPDLDGTDWRGAATTMAKGMYAMILGHPWLVPAMSTHLVYGPGKARHDDHLLGVFETAGFTARDADQATKVVFTFVLGTAVGAASEAAWKARLSRGGGDETERLQETITRMTEVAMRFPRLRAQSEGWSADDQGATAEHDLDFGLQTILDGLEAQLDARG
ncbi:TetR/AcrR family transcriptional regulator [Amycolatopsis sp. NPDC049868]|uniref:TetR/AcrR family transcriptional regulator n=1 Tax=Amycolatopsis sp. NPDC049868 TaxID=3363934 RepID=UPI003790096F